MFDRLNQNHFSPYFIFIKRPNKLTDDQLLQKLDLQRYTLVKSEAERETEDFKKSYLYITEDENWTQLFDDWSYSLWHDQGLKNRIISLSEKFEILTCWIGDIDESFGFHYFKKGKVVRQYIVEDSDFQSGIVVSDIGERLINELVSLQKKDAFDKVKLIAESQGVNFTHHKDKIRMFGASLN